MSFLNKMKVKTKLLLSFIIVAILIGVVGAIGIISLKASEKNSENMYNNNLQSVYLMSDVKQGLLEIKSDVLQLVYVKDASVKSALEKDIKDNTTEDSNDIVQFQKITMSDQEKQIVTTFNSQLAVYRTVRANVITLVDAGNLAEAVKQYPALVTANDQMLTSLDKLITSNIDSAKAADLNNKAITAGSSKLMTILLIAGLVIAIGLGLILTKNIVAPLKKIIELAENLAKFDLTYDYAVTRKDEFGKAGGALAVAQQNIKELVKAIIANSQDMSASSEELSATVEELSSKTQLMDSEIKGITAGIQDTSAASEQITASVQEVDANINQLSGKALEGSNSSIKSKEKATAAVEKGKDAIKEVRVLYADKKNSMLKAIEEGKVVDNIKVMAEAIASIAAQTNLLALNAAIEAARAGEQGKGFAVVAEEVRKLAEQSAEAVTGITETIVKVQSSFKNLSGNGSDVLKFINEKVDPKFEELGDMGNQYYNDADFVSKMSEEIASMSEELTATVTQVSSAVQNMSETAQKSSEHAEVIETNIHETTKAIDQVAETAQNQAELALKLNEMIQKFKI